MSWKVLLGLTALALLSCSPGPESPRGFRLPDGDVEAGQTAFAELGCVACHTVEGTTLEADDREREVHVRLGGKVHRVRTYGELVTSIIHPSESFAKGYPEDAVAKGGSSLMANYNDAMTVRQLIDLVSFLQSTYVEYLPKTYEPYFPGGN